MFEFADDTKLCHKVSCKQDRILVQSDFHTLVAGLTNDMNFNVQTCRVMQIETLGIKSNSLMAE